MRRRDTDAMRLGNRTVSFFAAGGWLIGIPFGYGRLNIGGLAPLATGGAGVAGFIFASFFGSLLALAGALLGTSTDARKAQKDHAEAKHGSMNHGKPSLVDALPIYGSIALVLFMALTLYVIASRAIGSGEASDQSNRVTWNQKNVARVGGATDTETATYVLQTAYPATRAENRRLRPPGTRTWATVFSSSKTIRYLMRRNALSPGASAAKLSSISSETRHSSLIESLVISPPTDTSRGYRVGMLLRSASTSRVFAMQG